MGPIAYTREHPGAVIISMAVGMIIGPWVLGTVNRFTGVSISLPTFSARSE